MGELLTIESDAAVGSGRWMLTTNLYSRGEIRNKRHSTNVIFFRGLDFYYQITIFFSSIYYWKNPDTLCINVQY